MPEEVNRIVADQLSDLLFVHSDEALRNLAAEGISADRVHFVGNTMIDTLTAMRERIEASDAVARLGLRPREYLLVTLHRPALVDGPVLADVVAALGGVARRLPVVFPVHPRTRRRLRDLALPPAVRAIEPLGYLDFLALQAGAAGVLTDSGGVQEETTFLGVPCFTLRDNTERPVTVRAGTNRLLGLDPTRIPGIVDQLGPPFPSPRPPPLWDGRAADRIAEVALERLNPLTGRSGRSRRRPAPPCGR